MSDEIDTTVEVWKTIPEAPFYSVSNYGRVRRDSPSKTHPAGLLKTGNLRNGYPYIALSNNGVSIKRSVHRLVAVAFIPIPPLCSGRNQVNHKNGVRTDNRAVNIEWVSASENIKHSFDCLGKKPTKGELNGCSKLTEADVVEIKALLQVGFTPRWLGSVFGVSRGAIFHIRSGATWSHVP